MSDVAGKLAIAKKAVSEMRETEVALLGSTVNQEQMNAAMSDVAEEARVVSVSVGDAIGILSKMKVDVEKFISEAEREMERRVRQEVGDAAD